MGRNRGGQVTQLERRLGGGREVLQAAIDAAKRGGVALYLVGGAVRDLLHGAEHLDLDVVVEGDALALAEDAATALRARVVWHPRFGTAVVRGEGLRVDVARARTEQYERPGALPKVRPSSLAEDLARRDFSMNAMALGLSGADTGRLIDPFHGQPDLSEGRVRTLHDGSFRDDATRILRALRYVGRLDFQLDPNTKGLLERDLSYLDTISGARLRREIELAACEERAAPITRLAADLGVLAAVHPALWAGERELSAIGRLGELPRSHRDAALLCLLLSRAAVADAEDCIARLALTGRQANAVRGFLTLREQETRLAKALLRPHEAVEVLEPLPPPAIEAFTLVAEQALSRARACEYLSSWRFVRPRLNGHDVEELGVPHGPQIGATLAALRAARLNGEVTSREDEVALVRSSSPARALSGARPG